jgi:hypothetical protein
MPPPAAGMAAGLPGETLMHARSTRPSGRARLAAFTAAAALAVGTALLGTTSAAYAAAPKLNQAAAVPAYTWVELTGTADPGVPVVLWETAYAFGDAWELSQQWFEQDIVSTNASSSGQFTLRRRLDSGFRFRVVAGGVQSNIVDVGIIASPSVQVTATGNQVSVTVEANPNEPFIPAAVQRWSGTAWQTVAQGNVGNTGTYSVVLADQPGGTHYYRAALGPSPANLVLVGHSDAVQVTLAGSGGTTPPPTTPAPGPTTPAPPNPTTPKPTTPKPTTPVVTGPKAGDVKFTLVQYDPPGRDTTSTKSLNSEYWRITNTTKKTVDMKYWTVKDRAGNTYKFPAFTLLAGRSVTIATGKGTTGKPVAWRYWGRTSHLLNNTGDALYLRTGSGKLIDGCNWGNGSGRTAC